MFREVYVKNVYLLGFLISLITPACSSIQGLLSKSGSRSEIHDWAVVSDQEHLSHLSYGQKAIFALAEPGFVVIYPNDRQLSAYIDDDLLLETDHQVFWLEELEVDKKLFFENAPLSNRAKTLPAGMNTEQNNLPKLVGEEQSQQDQVDLEIAIEIEGEKLPQEDVFEIGVEELESNQPKKRQIKAKPKVSQKFIVYVGGSRGLYAKSYTFTDRWILTNPHQKWVKISDQAVSHLTPRSKGGAWWGGSQGFGIVKHAEVSQVLGEERVKFLSEGRKGLYVVSFSDEVFVYKESQKTSAQAESASKSELKSEPNSELKSEPNSEPKSELNEKDIKTHEKLVQNTAASSSPQALEGSQQHTQSGKLKLKSNVLPDIVLEQTRIKEACEGPVLAMHAQASHEQVLFFCGSAQDSLVIKDKQGWHRFTQAVNMPQKSKLRSFQKGWIYQSRGSWYYLSTSAPFPTEISKVSQASSEPLKNADQKKTLQHSNVQVSSLMSKKTNRQLWLTTLQLTNLGQLQSQAKLSKQKHLKSYNRSQMSTWISIKSSQSMHDTLLIARPYQGLEQWSRLFAQRQKLTLKTNTLSAKVIQKAFTLGPEGELMTSTSYGTLIGTKSGWKMMKPKLNVGRVLGLAPCKDLLWVSTRKQSLAVDAKGTTEIKRVLELWPVESSKALISLDWSKQDFRQGEPSIGEIKCDAEGTIFANLFWGKPALRMSVGLLIIEPQVKKMTLWERKQGYDGEEELSLTPLLPSSTFNAMSFAKDQSLDIATNSGLMKVRYRAKTKTEQLEVFDEAHGLSVESFSDLHHEIEATGTEHLWLASPYGLLRMVNGELRIKLKGVVTALAYDAQRQNFWVSFKQQLWLGQGQAQERSWRRVYLPSELKIGQINHILPTAQGNLWLVSDQGVFLNRNLIQQLQ